MYQFCRSFGVNFIVGFYGFDVLKMLAGPFCRFAQVRSGFNKILDAHFVFKNNASSLGIPSNLAAPDKCP